MGKRTIRFVNDPKNQNLGLTNEEIENLQKELNLKFPKLYIFYLQNYFFLALIILFFLVMRFALWRALLFLLFFFFPPTFNAIIDSLCCVSIISYYYPGLTKLQRDY
ncbi:hypothetical protein [uncultured Chryseobacterium sp.]|uniref:hypothetical protein n=1 Tax=uncultured Chryseobacterium sp. TaxID=259322 RepID=UPI002582E234|nr:hypothetical protein [uncultured Chryseobacterium sp.]